MRAGVFLASVLLVVASGSAGGQPLAVVGSSTITSDDLTYRIETERSYGNSAVSQAVALVSLVNDSLEREVAAVVGAHATADEIQALSQHADRTSKAPAILAKIKAAFGDDRTSYDRLYLAPKVVNKKLRSYFNGNTALHQAERAKAQSALSLVLGGATLEEAAASLGLDVRAMQVGGEPGAVPPELQQYFPTGSAAGEDPLLAILETLDVGQVHGELFVDEGGFSVVKLVEKIGSVYRVETIGVAKRRFDEWFREEATKVSLQVTNPALGQALAAECGSVWWVGRLSGD